MRRYGRRIVLIGIAAALVGTFAPASPAVASANLDNIEGGCGFDTNQSAALGSAQSGVIYDASATLDANTPISAIVSCGMFIDGVLDADTVSNYSGFAVQYGVNSVSFTADPASWIDLCTRVQYGDGYDTGWVCPQVGFGPDWMPPEGNPLLLIDHINVFLTYHVDPVVCPVLVAHPGDYGPFLIKSDGDVYPNVLGYAGAPLYDCPPYNNF